MNITLADQKRTGVFHEHSAATFEAGAIRTDTRMTIPAREALERVSKVRDNAYYYQRPPTGLVAVLAPIVGEQQGLRLALRCSDEPPFPGEIANNDMWVEVDLTPCPKCGAALVWYEAGYVPGYRVCAGPKHHHYISKIREGVTV